MRILERVGKVFSDIPGVETKVGAGGENFFGNFARGGEDFCNINFKISVNDKIMQNSKIRK